MPSSPSVPGQLSGFVALFDCSNQKLHYAQTLQSILMDKERELWKILAHSCKEGGFASLPNTAGVGGPADISASTLSNDQGCPGL